MNDMITSILRAFKNIIKFLKGRLNIQKDYYTVVIKIVLQVEQVTPYQSEYGFMALTELEHFHW